MSLKDSQLDDIIEVINQLNSSINEIGAMVEALLNLKMVQCEYINNVREKVKFEEARKEIGRS